MHLTTRVFSHGEDARASALSVGRAVLAPEPTCAISTSIHVDRRRRSGRAAIVEATQHQALTIIPTRVGSGLTSSPLKTVLELDRLHLKVTQFLLVEIQYVLDFMRK